MSRERKTFTYEEAVALIPEVRRRTADAVAALQELIGEPAGEESEDDEAAAVETTPEFQQVVADWAESMLDLGAEVKGLWLVDFDSGSGYYCWRYPEPSLQFFHGYEEGFSGRIQLN